MTKDGLRITGVWTLTIVRNSKLQENTTFGKLDLFLSSRGGRNLLYRVSYKELTSSGPVIEISSF
jgi:hypothetical protein